MQGLGQIFLVKVLLLQVEVLSLTMSLPKAYANSNAFHLVKPKKISNSFFCKTYISCECDIRKLYSHFTLLLFDSLLCSTKDKTFQFNCNYQPVQFRSKLPEDIKDSLIKRINNGSTTYLRLMNEKKFYRTISEKLLSFFSAYIKFVGHDKYQ